MFAQMPILPNPSDQESLAHFRSGPSPPGPGGASLWLNTPLVLHCPELGCKPSPSPSALTALGNLRAGTGPAQRCSEWPGSAGCEQHTKSQT